MTRKAMMAEGARKLLWVMSGAISIAAGVLFGLLSVPVTNAQPASAASMPSPAEIAQRRDEQNRPRSVVPFEAQNFDKFVGYYQLNPNIFAHVFRKADHYFVQLTGQGPLEVFPESDVKFFLKALPAQISFETEVQGRSARLVLHQNGFETPAMKVDDATGQKPEAVLQARLKSNAPSAGTEAWIRRFIQSMEIGQPNYDEMLPGLADAVRQSSATGAQIMKSMGAFKSLAFKAVAPNNMDVYDATFENGQLEYSIAPLDAAGKAGGLLFRPLTGAAAVAPAPAGPAAESGAYTVMSETTYGTAGLKLFRPMSLEAFPGRDTLPVVVWGNGGCTFDTPVYASFLSTIASHGFLVLTTAGTPAAGAPGREATVDDLKSAIDWAARENDRAGSALLGKIAVKRVAVMGQSCGGELAIDLGADRRIGTVGVFDFGSTDADALKKLHGPLLFINGGEPDFMMAPSKATYEAIERWPAFYGSLHGAGHAGTVMQPGGGEFATVASDWALWQLKDDRKAAALFSGPKCALCTNPNWDTAAKRLAN